MDLDVQQRDQQRSHSHAADTVRNSAPARTELPINPTAVRAAAPAIQPIPAWKRAFDLIGAITGLVILLPFLMIVALLIKITSRGPVLFKHERFGLEGKPFFVWKFRSLHDSTNPQSHRHHVSQLVDERVLKKMDSQLEVTALGKLLRSTALDEVPQLLNVIKGEMSLVGPRPDVLPLEHHEPWQRTRFRILPGLTGLWQVSGKNKCTFNEMMQLDADYVRRRSLWLDLKIILMTGPAVLWQVMEDLQNSSE